eukprot:gnl/TRDRNA2_/TRDRNA2_147827_c0_seq1.p1 gnl/TRDRNA2_/TRDRNA2_147827_c0~~gnl/TRDRNA2_/TRDRNA2_147827_c0_seq1.p1  ORF type:complete len:665 (+),score=87.21 gnl/TRDRNA2_/TRDRNA2_147827_c0_seq1:138-1997(+)
MLASELTMGTAGGTDQPSRGPMGRMTDMRYQADAMPSERSDAEPSPMTSQNSRDSSASNKESKKFRKEARQSFSQSKSKSKAILHGDGANSAAKTHVIHCIVDAILSGQDNFGSESDSDASDAEDSEGLKAYFYGSKSLKPHKHKARLQKFVEHDRFNSTVGVLIVTNSLVLGLETDMVTESNRSVELVFWFIEFIFLILYTVELILRLVAFGPHRFAKKIGNLVDLFLVLVSAVDTLIISTVMRDDKNVKFAFIVLMLRLLRIFRMVRVIRLIRPLWLIVSSIGKSLRALFWSWLIILITIFVFALCMMQMLSGAMHDEYIAGYFGTVTGSMFTMFQIMTTENWPDIARECMRHRPAVFIPLCVFLCFTTIPVLSVINGIFVEGVISSAKQHDKNAPMRAKYDHALHRQLILELFCMADTDGSGQVTKKEMEVAMEGEDFREALSERGIKPNMIVWLFDLLDVDGSGTIDAREFVDYMLTCEGYAAKIDMISLDMDLRTSTSRVRLEAQKAVGACHERMQDTRSRLHALSVDIADLQRLFAERRRAAALAGGAGLPGATGASPGFARDSHRKSGAESEPETAVTDHRGAESPLAQQKGSPAHKNASNDLDVLLKESTS